MSIAQGRATPTLLLLIATLGAGCSAFKVEPVRPHSVVDHVLHSSYGVGDRRRAAVGEVVLAAYYVTKAISQVMKSDAAFELRGTSGFPIPPCRVKAGEEVSVVGTTRFEGADYTVISLCGRRYLVTAGGGITSPKPGRIHVEPAHVRLTAGVAAHSSPSLDDINYELIYGGTNGSAFSLTYREYTAEDLIRAGFSQTLTYPADAGEIRFRSVRMRIHNVSSDALEYTVIQNDLD